MRRVPKSRLGCVVATRLIRTAVRPLSAPLLPSRAQVLAAFCADDAADFALKLCASRASRLWADASRRESVAMAALRVSGLQERVMRRAARAAKASRLRVAVAGSGMETGADTKSVPVPSS